MSLARSAARGAALLSVTNLTAYAVSFGATLALARMVAPNEFGKVVFAIAVAELLFVLGAWSLPVALIREPQETLDEAFDTAMALLVPISGALVVASAGVAAGLWALEGAAIALVLLAIVGGRVLQLFAGCFIACLERDFAYGRFSLIQLASVGSGAAVALALAHRGAGVWALGARDVAVSVVMVALAVAFTRHAPGRRFSAAKARELLRFGAGMVGSRLGEMLFHRYDNLVVGVVSGARQLGLYNQGYVLTETGNRLYGPVLQQLPLATYARIQDDRERTARVFALLMFILSRGVTPLALLFLVLPGETLAFLYGEPWREGAPMLRLLSVYALLAPLFDQMRVLLVANGQVGSVLRARLWQLGLFLPAVPLCSWLWGGVGAAAAVAVGMTAGVVAIVPHVRRLAPLSWREFIAPVVAAAASAVAAFAVLSAGVEGDLPRLALGGLTLAAMYAMALALVDGARMLAHGRTILAGLRSAPGHEDRPELRAGALGAARATSRG
ncbi:MAG TPA: oligosaccharide flippase family protein [Dehalococcoidia bacterium]|nr:oligosaccharide flippase family protein [Dehalococcoidia bacterium]